VNSPPPSADQSARPVMLFDGDCRFCRLWIARWQQSTGDRVEYIPLQDARVAERFPQLPREELEASIHFVDSDGQVYRGAEAVFRCRGTNPNQGSLLRLYKAVPIFAKAADAGYGFVASHRQFFSLITRGLWGKHVERSPDLLTRWLFLRGLGVIYLIAFVSLWTQIIALVGRDGILPAADLMSQARHAFDADGIGMDRFRLLPTFCWLGASDGALLFQCALGAVLSVALIAGFAQRICLVALWLLYLSLATIGHDFLGFQWDNLLLEVGVISIFLAPSQIIPRPEREKPPSRAAIWLVRLLLFKLMFLSGIVKLASGDPLWRNLTALSHHYETQPLPNAIAWYVHQFPPGLQKISCALMFAIELVAPFLILAPRRLRLVGGLAIAALQVVILLTGNYTFFNWLTILLCFVACDDFTWSAVLPAKISKRYHAPVPPPAFLRWINLPFGAFAVVFVSVSALQIVSAFRATPSWSAPMIAVYRWISPLRSINSYGLFAVMTPDRPEIIVEGSADGREWKEYAFRYKPSALNRRPPFVAPHQPRLDWQMWFAALSDVRANPWFVNFCMRLLQGSPETLSLLESNPFPDAPPKYVRARLYDYHFTTRDERRRTGNWWKRQLKSEYLPPISLESFQR
jgi:predicted DCC family thiol-disulfide oxidoreductase YuxK